MSSSNSSQDRQIIEEEPFPEAEILNPEIEGWFPNSVGWPPLSAEEQEAEEARLRALEQYYEERRVVKERVKNFIRNRKHQESQETALALQHQQEIIQAAGQYECFQRKAYVLEKVTSLDARYVANQFPTGIQSDSEKLDWQCFFLDAQ